MALSSAYIKAPAAAAAMGLYIFGRNLSHNHGGVMEASATGSAAKEMKDGRSAVALPPKLAPQFDGLFCFETIVRR